MAIQIQTLALVGYDRREFEGYLENAGFIHDFRQR